MGASNPRAPHPCKYWLHYSDRSVNPTKMKTTLLLLNSFVGIAYPFFQFTGQRNSAQARRHDIGECDDRSAVRRYLSRVAVTGPRWLSRHGPIMIAFVLFVECGLLAGEWRVSTELMPVPNVFKFPSAERKALARDGSRTVALDADRAIAGAEGQLLIRTRPAVEKAILLLETASMQVRRVIDCIFNEPTREIMLDQLATIEQQIEFLRSEAALLPADYHDIIQEKMHVQP